jgi:hypothetical protein
VLLSPRNYFLYTPLLPAVAAGTMEERSIVEPVRSIMAGKVWLVMVDVGMRTVHAVLAVTQHHMHGQPELCCRSLILHTLQGTFYEAQCTKIDPVRKEVSACFPRASDGACTDPFTLSYDVLIVAVRAASSSGFGAGWLGDQASGWCGHIGGTSCAHSACHASAAAAAACHFPSGWQRQQHVWRARCGGALLLPQVTGGRPRPEAAHQRLL